MIKRIYNILKRHHWGIGGLLALCFFTKSWGFLPAVPNYVIWALLVYIIFQGLKTQGATVKIALAFLMFCPIGIIMSHPDPMFKSWLRYGNFALLFIAIAPVFFNKRLHAIRKQALDTVCVLSIFTAIGSFICFFLGVNYMRMMGSETLMYTNAGRFGGLTVHSMTLGPLSAIAVVSLYYVFMQKKSKIALLLALVSMGSVFFSASRSALLAALVGIAFCTLYGSENRRKSIRTLIGVTVVAAVTYPLWNKATYLMEQKQVNNIEAGSMTDSRNLKFKYRLDEFKSSPIWGIGFCAIDPHCGDDYEAKSGTIEPGSSWLGVLSMTGLVGFVLFCGIIHKAFYCVKKQRFKQRALLLGLLLVFLVHFLAEGYVLSAGNELCFISWLVIACCLEKYTPNNHDVFILDEFYV